MTQVAKNSNSFKENYHGILDHDGCIRVAKGNTKHRIIHVNPDNDTVLVYSNRKRKGFVTHVHKDLKPLMYMCEESDTGFIKWRKGKAWLVGFQKLKDRFISELMRTEDNDFTDGVDYDFVSYFQRHKELSDLFPDYEMVSP